MRRWLAFLTAAALLALCACGTGTTGTGAPGTAASGGGAPAADSAEPVSAEVFAMDTYMTLSVYQGDGDAAAALQEAEELIRTIESEVSVTSERSALYAVNRDGGGTVPPEAAALLRRALELCALTGGALDITLYPLSLAWGFTTPDEDYRVPEPETLRALLELVGYQRVGLTPAAGGAARVTLEPGMMLDLGAVAKGWTGDQVRARLLRLLGEDASALLELGGNIQAVGAKPDGSAWRVGVRDPEGNGIAAILTVRDCAVITSGGYERYFVSEGRRYWHILDPKTGEPADSGLKSATIVGAEGALCDALSTALFVMGPERAAQFWRETRGFDFLLLGEDGSVTISEGLEGRCTLAGNWADAPLTVVKSAQDAASPPGSGA